MKDAMAVYNQINLYGQENGMELTVLKPGHIKYTMEVLQKHLSSPVAAHGGAIAGLMDGVLGVASLSQSFLRDMLVSTVEFKINYLTPVRPGDVLIGEGIVDHEGKSLLIASGDIRIQNRDMQLAAKGQGTFNAYPIANSEAHQLFQHLLKQRD